MSSDRAFLSGTCLLHPVLTMEDDEKMQTELCLKVLYKGANGVNIALSDLVGGVLFSIVYLLD